ncbi:DUF599 domain-containing protein [Rhodovulum sp. DZ06]|uniref:DUF599 domain-containing protein n=1 Tax=Rhodovulum sp. DZ06 TaxID=3425126 RepID=UPI003D32606D
MTPLSLIDAAFFSWRDAAALGLFLLLWFGMTWAIERAPARRPSTAQVMGRYRMRWMEQMLLREPRILDGALLAQLRSGTAFFASGCMIAIGGAAALLGQAEQVVSLAQDLSADQLEISRTTSEAKILFLVVLLVSAFLRFVWAHRLFGYCAILMGAVGRDADEAENQRIARKAGLLNISAGKSFNRGLRQLYFCLAALAWFLGPEAFGCATLATAAVLHRREFRSDSRKALLDDD